MKPGSPVTGEGYARLEQRSVSMLLAALPEGLRQDVIASRRLLDGRDSFPIVYHLSAWWFG